MKAATASEQTQFHGVSLIEGEFTANEAREQLLKLYEDNIRYYGARNFSEQIRNGAPDSYSEMKLQELSQAKASTIEILEKAQALGLKIKIESDVRITLTRD